MKLTKKEVVKYLYLIRLNFENAYPYSGEDLDLLVESWAEILSDYPKEICDRALKNALAKATFAPRIGDIVTECEILINPDRKSDEELWAELMAIKYDVYDASRYLQYPQHRESAQKNVAALFESLNGDLKAYLVNAEALIDFSEMSREDLQYEKNRFFKRMPEVKKHAAERKQATDFMKLVESKTLKLSDKKN